MSKLLLIFIFALFCFGLAGCARPETDTFCQTHTLSDFQFRAPVINSMTMAEKRKYLKILVQGQRLCGWRPPH